MKTLLIGIALLAGIASLPAAETPAPNYYELRIYDVTSNKLDGVVERFSETVNPVRQKHGIECFGYWTSRSTNGDKFIYRAMQLALVTFWVLHRVLSRKGLSSRIPRRDQGRWLE